MSKPQLRVIEGDNEVKKRKKVAILGTVPHKVMAPFDNDEFEIWAIAHACLGEPLPRVDRIFEIHKWDEVVKWGSPQAWVKHPNIPVYIREVREDVPNSIAFPFDELAKKFKIFDDREECMMTNSISWMIGLALDEDFEEIHIYGVNMSHSSEYGFQKPSCEYYLGLAKGMGKKIYVPTESDLCKSFHLYGKDEEKVTEVMKKYNDRLDFLTKVHANYLQQQAFNRDMMMKFSGALEQWEFIKTSEKTKMESMQLDEKGKEIVKKVLEDIDKKIQQLTEEYRKHQMGYEQGRDAANQHIGAIEDVKYWMLITKQ